MPLTSGYLAFDSELRVYLPKVKTIIAGTL